MPENLFTTINDLTDWSRAMFAKAQAELVLFTQGCRGDMHEPDEQGIVFTKIMGTKLDNAGTKDDILIVLKNEHTGKSILLNLATLIALARTADIED